MRETDKYTDRDWEELAARFSDEKTGNENANLTGGDDVSLILEKKWRQAGMTGIRGNIDVDGAWNRLYSRLRENGLLTRTVRIGERNSSRLLLRLAASVAVIACLGLAALYITSNGILSREETVIAGNDQKNIEVQLPDGSRIWLNRNSKLTYYPGNSSKSRYAKLTGEAYFEIIHNPDHPFTVEAGNARITDLGTSFNVITNNTNEAVEVFVNTGKVKLADPADKSSVILDPGFVGVLSESGTTRSHNENRNYLSWKTELLTYDGESLKNVFSDLKRVHNINIVADDPQILDEILTATFVKSPQDAIIEAICLPLKLKFHKEGNIYHISKK
jgi:transmembrane sensor